MGSKWYFKGPRRTQGCRKEGLRCRIRSHQLQQEDPSNGRRTRLRHRKVELLHHQGNKEISFPKMVFL